MDNDQKEFSTPESKTRGRRTNLGFYLQVLLRISAVIGTICTLWIIVGSVWFPGWWYGAIWNANLLNSRYFNYGWLYLLDTERWLLFGILTTATVVAMYFYFRRSRFFSIVDRLAVPAIIVCMALLIADAIFLHQPRYENEANFVNWLSGSVTPTMLEDLLSAKPPVHEILPPVDFHYIDTVRVNALYSEIEPNLIETERTILASKKQTGSVGLETGPATLKGEAAKERQETNKYERSDTSSERKCVQIMNFILNNGSAHYYTTIGNFYSQQALEDALEAGRVAANEAMKKFDPSTLKPLPLIAEPSGKVTPEQRRSVSKQVAQWSQKFRQESQGFVVVNGTFHITRTTNNIVFEEEFSPRPQHIVFRFTLPASFDSDVFQNGSRMRVFGDVVQGTDDLGVLTIHPLAVFNE